MSTKIPEGVVGVGLNTDMTGDPRPIFIRRFWMPRGAEKMIVFLTEGDEVEVIWEHQAYVGGSWLNWFRCVEPFGMKCRLCEWAEDNNGKHRRYKAAMFTIIDCSEYKDKKGNMWKNQKSLMACKKDTQEILALRYKDRVEEDEGLRGALFRVLRTNGDKSCSVGEDFTFKRMVAGEEFEDIEPFNVSEVCAIDKEAVEKVVARLYREKGGNSKVPFEAGGSKVDY